MFCMDAIRSNHHVSYITHYHVVFCPKYRRKVLVQQVETRLKQIITEVCQEHNAILEQMEVMPDHVHLLVSVDPQFGIHRLIKLLKGRSSRLLRQEYP
jgi:putative transposase